MSFLTGWVTNIIIFIILATIMDMLLPNTAMRKYAKMVIGLLLITIMLSPIFKLLSTDVDKLVETAMSVNTQDDNMENLIDSKKKEIQAVTSAYILEEVAVQLKTDGEEELINRYNYAFEHIEVSLKTLDNPVIPEDIAVISVILAEHAEDNAIETVQLVDIDTKKSLTEQSKQSDEIKQFLATQWGIDAEQIEVDIRFGSAN
ncbi:MAG: stage III sporulation protein AF [Bacillus sp. (in: firmicutes)]